MWDWILKNGAEVVIVVIFVASVIVKFTPNTGDNKVVNFIVNLLDHLSLAKTQQDKDLIQHAKENTEEKTK